MDSITKGMVAPDRKIRKPPFVASSDQIQTPEAMRASRIFSGDTSIPSTAAA